MPKQCVWWGLQSRWTLGGSVAASSKSLQCLSVSQLCSVMSAVSRVLCAVCCLALCHVPMVFVGAAVAADGQDRPRERKKKVQSVSVQLRLCLCFGSVVFGVPRKTK